MSATRPPARSPDYERQPEELEDLEELDQLEELGDEAIIAQQTAAHALQPRANVSEESRSVVITEHPERRDSRPPRNALPKSSVEATLVIRDRRALDEMRQKIVRRQKQKQAHGRRALYLWGALGLVAFVLGGIVAFLATEAHPGSATADSIVGNARRGIPEPAFDPRRTPGPHRLVRKPPSSPTRRPPCRTQALVLLDWPAAGSVHDRPGAGTSYERTGEALGSPKGRTGARCLAVARAARGEGTLPSRQFAANDDS